ncbi:hypothetical protein [Parafrankia soli]|uniref:hypothetical protein n=1 Tax=Parafrankia soli TaxID=2599596 RepID=UPI001F522171|nr:hypothetical protein [Parafrankia soli]
MWESTAIPEIRGQAAALARAVVAALPGPRVVRRVRDPYGLPLTASPEAADRYVAGLGRILRVRSGAETLAVEPTAGHAVHAKTHVHYETGDHEAGLAWLDGWISTCGSDSSHRAHFAWHAALHELALGDDSAARTRFSTQLSPPAVSGVRALIDSASLLWRGFAAGAWTSVELGPVLETVPGTLLVDPPMPFVGLHSAVALAAAGDCRRLAQLRRSAAARTSPVFTDTVAPLADALMHLLHGDPDRATDALIALPGVERLGGSAAQREIVEDTTIYCAIQANRPNIARSLLQNRLERRCSPRDVHRRAQLLTGQQTARSSPSE